MTTPRNPKIFSKFENGIFNPQDKYFASLSPIAINGQGEIEYHKYLVSFNRLYTSELVVLWNERARQLNTGDYIFALTDVTIDDLFAKPSDYQKALDENRFDWSHLYCHITANGLVYTFHNDLAKIPNHPTPIKEIKDWLETKANDSIQITVVEFLDQMVPYPELNILWNKYCQSIGSSALVFPNPDPEHSDMQTWVQIKNGEVVFAEHMYDIVSLPELASWIIATDQKSPSFSNGFKNRN